MYLAFNGKDSYFFDPDNIVSYDEPIFTNIDKELLEHYELKKNEIRAMRRNLIFLHDNKSLSVKFLEHNEINISARHKGGSFFSSHFNYKSEESKDRLQKIQVTPDELDRLKAGIKRSGCFSFEKKEDLRIGFKDAKSGTFYYRFTSANDPPNLQDSCLIMKVDDQVYLEYSGNGRGPDCVKNKNPEGYDDRNFFQKWLGLIWNRKVVFE